MTWLGAAFGVTLALMAAPATVLAAPDLATMLSYPFRDGLTASANADRISWTGNIKGIRAIWTASGPNFHPQLISVATSDDGQELTGLVVSPDGKQLAWVRGGDHDANWAGELGLQPNPASAADQPKLAVWVAPTSGGGRTEVGEGDAPALADGGRIAYVKNGELWVGLAAKGGTARVYDAGHVTGLAWSPDGSRLAFVSMRGDHSFVGVYAVATKAVTWAAASTGHDTDPIWSPDGERVAFTRRFSNGGAPEPLRVDIPRPWAIVVANAATGAGHVVWASPRTLVGSYPGVPGGASLVWLAGDTLAFRAEFNGWPHLYALPVAGGAPTLLTPGSFIVEDVTPTRDRRGLLYTANTGADASDDDRRHVFRVALDGSAPVAVTAGTGLEYEPVPLANGDVALVSVTAQRPAMLAIARTVSGRSSAPPTPIPPRASSSRAASPLPPPMG